MKTITVNPSTLAHALQSAAPGDHFELMPGTYGALRLRDLKGTAAEPIELVGQAGVIFDGGRRYQDFRLEANREARRIQGQDRFPGVYEWADRGHVRFTSPLKKVLIPGFYPLANQTAAK